MELELKHIAPYLPYGLKAVLSDEGVFNLDSEYPNEYKNEICTIKHFSYQTDGFSGSMIVDKSKINYSFDFDSLSEVEIILRPLSDLKKTGLTDLYIDLIGVYNGVVINDIIDNKRDTSFISYYYMERLLQNHFDVFGLIEKGLAIDINTLEQ